MLQVMVYTATIVLETVKACFQVTKNLESHNH